MKIHNTAIIDSKAELSEGVEVGPYTIIEADVKIGKMTRIGPYVVIKSYTTIGESCDIHMGVVIGNDPQDFKFSGKRSYVRIGNRNVIREYTTIHRASDEEGVTIIGDDNFIMASSHVAHNCKIGNGVTIVNFAGLTGHVEVEDNAFISGLAAIHQFVRIGRLAIVGGASKVVKDVPPFMMVDGHPAKICGLNIVGLRRNGFSQEARETLKRVYKILFKSNLNVGDALERIKKEVECDKNVDYLIEFIQSSKRGICGFKESSGEDPPDDGCWRGFRRPPSR